MTRPFAADSFDEIRAHAERLRAEKDAALAGCLCRPVGITGWRALDLACPLHGIITAREEIEEVAVPGCRT